MNNREAIALLRNLEDSLGSYCELNEEGKTAFRMAIEALNCSEIPNNSDTISRQAALNATSTTLRITGKENAETVYKYIKKLCDDIKALPPIQPDVIRCKDCKWWDKYSDTRGYCLAAKYGCWSGHWEIRIRRIYDADWYCADAERKE